MNPEYRRLFDEPLDRTNTHCLKWDAREAFFGDPCALPMWVADMDFRAPQEVTDEICERARHGAFGYEWKDPEHSAAAAEWLFDRHGLRAEPQWILTSQGVVASIHAAVGALTQPGDKVVVPSPVYGPFFSAVTGEGRELVTCSMAWENGRWEMDLNRVEEALRDGGRMLLVCNPHNPLGRVWTREELEALSGLCRRYGAALVSDEIHSDFIRAGHKHTCILSVDPGAVELHSATKTFNLAALRHSTAVAADPGLRKKLAAELSRRGTGTPNLMGALAQTAAYRHGGMWVDSLNEYLDESREMMEAFIRERLPQFHLTRSEGTYLLWLDARATGLSGDDLVREFVRRAGVCFSGGEGFGSEGKGYLRINISTTHANVRRALEGMERGFALG